MNFFTLIWTEPANA